MSANEAIQPSDIEAVSYETRNAFHGTIASDAQSIWRERKFSPPKSPGRFGPGIYFWENSRGAARKWVQIFYKSSDWGIIRANVRCVKMLDLLTAEHFSAMERVQSRLQRRTGRSYNHAAVLGLLHAASFIDGVRLIAGVSPQTRVHTDTKLAGPFDVILCIYEPMNIVVSAHEDSSTRPSAS